MSKITNDRRLNPVWHRILYSCTHMATVGVKGLSVRDKVAYRIHLFGFGTRRRCPWPRTTPTWTR